MILFVTNVILACLTRLTEQFSERKNDIEFTVTSSNNNRSAFSGIQVTLDMKHLVAIILKLLLNSLMCIVNKRFFYRYVLLKNSFSR